MPEKKTEKQLVSAEELALLTDITARRVRQLAQEGIIKPEKVTGANGKRYDLQPTLLALLKYYREKLSKRDNAPPDLNAEKLRQVIVRRELDEIKLRLAKGEIHRTADIEKVFGVMLTRLRVGLQSIPLGVAPLLTEKADINEIAEIIDNRISRTLFELINFDFDIFSASGGKKYIDEIEAAEGSNDE